MNVIIKFMLFTSIINTSYILIIVKIFFTKIFTLCEPSPVGAGRVPSDKDIITAR